MLPELAHIEMQRSSFDEFANQGEESSLRGKLRRAEWDSSWQGTGEEDKARTYCVSGITDMQMVISDGD
jgi:hypothetical protein